MSSIDIFLGVVLAISALAIVVSSLKGNGYRLVIKLPKERGKAITARIALFIASIGLLALAGVSIYGHNTGANSIARATYAIGVLLVIAIAMFAFRNKGKS